MSRRGSFATPIAKRNGPLGILFRLRQLCCFDKVIRSWLRLVPFGLSIAAIAFGQVNVLNVNYDNQQTGANLRETSLSPQIDWTTFGKVGTFPVDGQVY